MGVLDTAAPTIRYSFAELERLWIDAGGSNVSAPIAAAIAEAESGGFVNALNPHDPNATDPKAVSRGLWQINSANFQPGTNGFEFYDAQVAASKAVELWKGRGGTVTSFQDWGSFNGTLPTYTKFLNFRIPPALRAIGTKTSDPTTKAPSGPSGDPLIDANAKAAAGVVSGFTSWQPWLDSQIFQIGIATIGLAIVAGGIAIAAAPDAEQTAQIAKAAVL